LTSLSILDRLLALLVLIAMILGVVIGVYAPNVQEIFNKEAFAGTSIRTWPHTSIALYLCTST
jgi:ACR3 family arsenite transporter